MLYRRRTQSYELSEGGGLRTAATKSRSSVTVASPARFTRTAAVKASPLMFSTLIGALSISIAHHFFLFYLDGRSVDGFPVSQTLVRSFGNALSGMVKLLLQISVGIALTQSIWLYIRRNNATLNNLDVLFSLPSFSTWPASPFRRGVLYALILTGAIQSLSLIGVFAPNALSVVTPQLTNHTLSVPSPRLGNISANASSYFKPVNDSVSTYITASPRLQRLARSVLDSAAILSWAPPLGCGRECHYNVSYWGPGLNCTDIPPSSIGLLPTNSNFSQALDATIDPNIQTEPDPSFFLSNTYLYNATATFLNASSLAGWNSNSTTWAESGNRLPISLDVVYASNAFSLPRSNNVPNYYNITGHNCTFYNARYHAFVHYTGGARKVDISIVDSASFETALGVPVDVSASIALGNNMSDTKVLSAYSALSLIAAMSQYFHGTVSFDSTSQNVLELAPPNYTSALNSIITTHANVTQTNVLKLYLVSPSYESLGRLLEDACTNLTASLMSDTFDFGVLSSRHPVQARARPESNVYKYQSMLLWLVYGTGLAVSLLVDLYGLSCVVQNGGTMQNSFSSIAASVRNRDLNALFSASGQPLLARSKRIRLRYRTSGSMKRERAGFTVVEDDDDGEGAETNETSTLAGSSEAHT